jgi:23S rRNA (pseudouridine1915-N3)-methyltransferase
MRLRILAIGDAGPKWLQTAFADYQGRFPPHLKLDLQTQASAKRSADVPTLKRLEAKWLDEIAGQSVRVALDERGVALTSVQLAKHLAQWMQSGKDVSLLIGGADGLDERLRSSADLVWSLSALTLPHHFVRLMLAEALYRAHSINANLPYHRA